MENISASEILELLADTKRISFYSAYGTKLISNKSISGSLDIFDLSLKESVTFLHCSFADVTIDNTHCDVTIEFKHCTFSKDFRIIFIKASVFNLENCQFEKAFIIQKCTLRYLIFDRVESQNGIMIEGGQIILLDIKPINEKTSFSFTGMFLLIHTLSVISQSGITTFAKNCIINIINLTGYLNIASRLDFTGIKNKKIAIYDLNSSGRIYFSNIKPVGVAAFRDKPLAPYIEQYSKSPSAEQRELHFISQMAFKAGTLELLTGNYPLFSFREYMEKNHFTDFLEYFETMEVNFHIHNSSPGILELKTIMFERYHIEIINSDLSAVKLLHAKIPDVEANDDYLNYYNVYNDLYTAAGRQNNTKDKAFYYKIAQHYLYRYLKYESHEKDSDLGTRIAITASKIYSRHGTDWIRASIVTSLVTFVFFCFFSASLKGAQQDISWNGIAYFHEFILPFFFQFLNPIHRIDFMSEIGTLGRWSALFDLASRIFMAIGIFEILRSFRKHVRQ